MSKRTSLIGAIRDDPELWRELRIWALQSDVTATVAIRAVLENFLRDGNLKRKIRAQLDEQTRARLQASHDHYAALAAERAAKKALAESGASGAPGASQGP